MAMVYGTVIIKMNLGTPEESQEEGVTKPLCTPGELAEMLGPVPRGKMPPIEEEQPQE
jgi:hypothetical protein